MTVPEHHPSYSLKHSDYRINYEINVTRFRNICFINVVQYFANIFRKFRISGESISIFKT